MALPWLESLSAFAATPRARLSRSASPFCSWAMASTRITGAPKARAPTMKLSKTPVAARAVEAQDQRDPRPVQQALRPARAFTRRRRAACSPARPFSKAPIINAGITVDQMIANHIGQDTPQSSIVLACEQPMTGYHETNFSMAYSSHISWQNAGLAGAERSLSVARVRQPVRESRQPSQHEHSRPREGRRRRR